MKMYRPVITLLIFLFLLLYSETSESQGSWETPGATNSPDARHENAFVRVGDKFYLLGGRGIKPVGIYDPATKTWSEGASIPLEISHCQAVTYNGLIYLMGGLVGNWPSETPLTHVFIYNPLMDTWIVGPEIPADRQRGAAGAVVHNNKIYVVCGIVNGHTSGWVPWLDEYDPATNAWKILPDAPHARDHLQAAVVNDQLVVTGGRKSGYEGQGLEATVAETDIYDFNTGKWRTLDSPSGDIPTQRAGCTVVTVDNEIIVIGGESGSQEPAHSEVEALNIETGSWRSLPPLQRGRHGTQVLLSEGDLYIATGCGNRGGSPELDSFEKFELSGFQGTANTPLVAGELQISETSLDFGTTRPYATQAETITLAHVSGNQGIPIVYMLAAPSMEFKVDFPYPLPYVLSPGENVSFKVYYTPTSGDSDESTLFIKLMDRGKLQPQELALKGN
jgi:N-acetylneuraminic acid mutarotase